MDKMADMDSTPNLGNTARDPVCGMDVNPDQAAGKSEYMGQTYYFYSPGCKKQFDQNPERYAGQQATQA